jgi:hypothetical protein
VGETPILARLPGSQGAVDDKALVVDASDEPASLTILE